MIKKIDVPESTVMDASVLWGGINDNVLAAKINEVIDAVNELQKDYDNVCIWVGEHKLNYNPDTTKGLSTLVEEPEPADPYAEQRKWIGKLCWFWDGDKKDGAYGVLSYIKEGWESCYVQKGHYSSYKYCEPASEDLIYKGE